MVLETSQERVKLLKAGMTGKQIESLYIQLNGFKIVGTGQKRRDRNEQIQARYRLEISR
jgi:hypothetical protein